MVKTAICNVCKRTYIDSIVSTLDYFWRCVIWCIVVLIFWIIFEFRADISFFLRDRLQWIVGFCVLASYVVFGEGLFALLDMFSRLSLQFVLRVIIVKIRDCLDSVTQFIQPANDPPVIVRRRPRVALAAPRRDLRSGDRLLRSGKTYC